MFVCEASPFSALKAYEGEPAAFGGTTPARQRTGKETRISPLPEPYGRPEGGFRFSGSVHSLTQLLTQLLTQPLTQPRSLPGTRPGVQSRYFSTFFSSVFATTFAFFSYHDVISRFAEPTKSTNSLLNAPLRSEL